MRVTDYYLTPRLPDDLPNDPMHWVNAWLDDAAEKEVKRNPNSMAIITSGSDARPSARMVLCKDFHADPGYLVFYTNYQSNKARQIDENSNVAVLFHWDQLGRQVRIEGQAVRSPDAESDAYFASRDWGSQIGAWGSDQSAPLESRNALIAQVGKRALKLGVNVAKNLPTSQAFPGPRIGVGFAFGRVASNSGSRAKIASMTARVGNGLSHDRMTIHFLSAIGLATAYNPKPAFRIETTRRSIGLAGNCPPGGCTVHLDSRRRRIGRCCQRRAARNRLARINLDLARRR